MKSNAGRMMRIWPVILAVHLSGGGLSLASFPSVAVTLTRTQAPPEFSLKVAGTDTPPQVRSLIVAAPERREILCHLESTLEAPVVRVRMAKWRYGEPVRDFEERQPCRTLTAGRYSLIVDAEDARGSVTFEVDKSGRVVLVR
jgi:hypothetical protein